MFKPGDLFEFKSIPVNTFGTRQNETIKGIVNYFFDDMVSITVSVFLDNNVYIVTYSDITMPIGEFNFSAINVSKNNRSNFRWGKA